MRLFIWLFFNFRNENRFNFKSLVNFSSKYKISIQFYHRWHDLSINAAINCTYIWRSSYIFCTRLSSLCCGYIVRACYGCRFSWIRAHIQTCTNMVFRLSANVYGQKVYTGWHIPSDIFQTSSQKTSYQLIFYQADASRKSRRLEILEQCQWNWRCWSRNPWLQWLLFDSLNWFCARLRTYLFAHQRELLS